ncbi:MAG: hypothetical protein IPK97_09020 [Ahniella sp.]|nr:hypothetical protein [Ahniella sp.]
MARLKKAPIVVLGSIIAMVVTNCRMNSVADDTHHVFAQGGNVSVGSATGAFSGNLVYDDVAVWPDMTSETTEATRADEVTISTPGIGWLLGAAFGNNRVDAANRGFALPDELSGASGKGPVRWPSWPEGIVDHCHERETRPGCPRVFPARLDRLQQSGAIRCLWAVR